MLYHELSEEKCQKLLKAYKTFNETLEKLNIQLVHFEGDNIHDSLDVAIDKEGYKIDEVDGEEITRYIGTYSNPIACLNILHINDCKKFHLKKV